MAEACVQMSASKFRRERKHRCLRRLWTKSRWAFLAGEHEDFVEKNAVAEMLRDAAERAADATIQLFVSREDALVNALGAHVVALTEQKLRDAEARLSRAFEHLDAVQADTRGGASPEPSGHFEEVDDFEIFEQIEEQWEGQFDVTYDNSENGGGYRATRAAESEGEESEDVSRDDPGETAKCAWFLTAKERSRMCAVSSKCKDVGISFT